MNFWEDVRKLETSIQETKEFQQLKEAFEIVRKDEQAKRIFAQFRNLLMEFQRKQMQGEPLQEDEYIHLQKMARLAEKNSKIQALLEAELALGRLIDEANRLLAKPVQSLYEGCKKGIPP